MSKPENKYETYGISQQTDIYDATQAKYNFDPIRE